MIWDKWSRDENGNSVSELYAINTEGIFMTNPKHKYPNKKDVEFDVEHIGKIFQTDTPATYFEKVGMGKTSIQRITQIMWEMELFAMVVQVVVKHIGFVVALFL